MSFRHSVLGLAVLLATTTGVFAASETDWAMTRYDESQCGYTSLKLDQPLTLCWQNNTTRFAGNPSTPSVVNGVAYFASGNRIHAVDMASGALKWRYPNSTPLTCNVKTGVTVSDDMVLFGGTDGALYAMNAEDGKLLWTFPTRGPIRSTPIVSGGTVYVGSDDNSLYAINANTGEMFWASGFRTRDDVLATPAISPGMVIFTSMDTYVYAANISTGKLRWSFRTPNSPVRCAPVVSGNQVYVAAGSMIYVMSVKNGQVRYTISLPSDIAAPPAVAGDDLYILCRNKKLYSYVVGMSDPKKKWANPIDVGQLSTIPPTVVGDVVYVGCNRGMINGYSCEDGKLVWSYTCAPSTTGLGNIKSDFTEIAAPIIAADGALLVLTDDGSLRCFRSRGADNTPPRIFNMTPEASSTMSGQPPLKISAILYDESTGVDPESVKIFIGANEVETKEVEATFDIPTLTVSFELPVTRPITKLPDGRHYITVIAKDWKGNQLTHKWSFLVDNSLAPKALPASYRDNRPPTSTRSSTTPTKPTGRRPTGSTGSAPSGDAGESTPPAPPVASSTSSADDSAPSAPDFAQ